MENILKEGAEKFLENIKENELRIYFIPSPINIFSLTILIPVLKKLDARFSLNSIESPPEIPFSEKNTLVLTTQMDSKPYTFTQIENAYLFSKKICKILKVPLPESILKTAFISISEESEFYQEIKEELEKNSKIKIKEGFKISPCNRPINRSLEYDINQYIPEITGNPENILMLLKESQITPINGTYPTAEELSYEDAERLSGTIIFKNPSISLETLLGTIKLINFFNGFEDLEEIRSKIHTLLSKKRHDLAIKFLLEIPDSKKEVDSIYIKERQAILSSIKKTFALPKNSQKNYEILFIRNEIPKNHLKYVLKAYQTHCKTKNKKNALFLITETEERCKIFPVFIKEKKFINTLKKALSEINGDIAEDNEWFEGTIPKDSERLLIESLKKHSEVELVKV